LVKDQKTPEISTEKDQGKNKKKSKEKLGENSLLGSIKGLFSVESFEKDQNIQKTQKHHSSNSSEIKKTDNRFDTPVRQEKDTQTNKDRDTKNSEAHEVHDHGVQLLEHWNEYDSVKRLKTKKNEIIKIIAILVGIILIVFGLIFSLGTVIQVSSNVIFGERAMFSAFLILLGFLILAAVFARRLLEVTFLKNIHNELEIAEGKTPKNKDNHTNRKDKAPDKKG